jgi:choline dehydrogenase
LGTVLPYLAQRAQRARRHPWHGSEAPVRVRPAPQQPAVACFIAAGQQAGYAANADFNGPQQQGFGLYQVTQKDGARCSSAVAYLNPVRQRANLTIITGARVSRITFEAQAAGGRRASGVVYTAHGKAYHQPAAREVLLSGGAINSPQLLMLSGIGPAAQLRRHGIDVVADAPQVGENLQDHLDVCTLRHSTQPITYDRVSDLRIAFDYYLRGHRGPGSSNIAEAGAFVRSARADERADIQMRFVPAMLDDRPPSPQGRRLHCTRASCTRAAAASAWSAPTPRTSADRGELPHRCGGSDLKMMVECARLAREVFAQKAFDAYRGAPIMPPRDDLDDDDLVEFIRAKAETVYHPVGTCRMGSDDQSVVDTHLRVRGVEGLRVIDAS